MFGHKKEKDASEPVILMNVAGNYELGLVKAFWRNTRSRALCRIMPQGDI